MPTVWPITVGFLIGAVAIPLVIDWQRRRNIGQQIYEDGPKAHAAKQGTPTMGGLAFIAAALAGVAFSQDAGNVRLAALAAGAGGIGAIDDLLIIGRRRALGLSARWKFALLAALGAVYLTLLQSGAAPLGYEQRWFGGPVELPAWLWWFLSFGAIVGAANAVNLTDGLDGLAGGAVIAPLLVLSFVALSPICVCVLGACVAFLWFNRHPARVFMGDAGSLLLGALLAGAAIQSGTLLFLPLLGIVFVVEALSVIAQVISFKTTGKRILKMSPLHHHFELSGWSERRVTATFVAASAVAAAATAFAMISANAARM